MALDLIASVRSTALVALVTASFSSPIVVKTDAFASASARITGREVQQAEPTEPLVAGGVQFAMPSSWGRLGPTAAASAPGAGGRIGTVVGGLCPGGSAGAACADATRVTFIAYSGDKGHQLPKLEEFQARLDARLAREFPGFRKGESGTEKGAGGTHRLDYRFSWRSGKARAQQRFAAYRHKDGSGVVVMITGAGHKDHAPALERFVASGHGLDDGGH